MNPVPIVEDADFVRGEKLYAAGAFWDAHEAWEILWNRETDPSRRALVQALILIAAAVHKLLVMKRPDRAPGMIARAVAKLAALPAAFEGIDVAGLRLRAAAFAEAVLDLEGEARLDIAAFPRAAIPRWERDTTGDGRGVERGTTGDGRAVEHDIIADAATVFEPDDRSPEESD